MPLRLGSLLLQPIIGEELALGEVRRYTEERVPRMPTVGTADEWEAHARRLREEALERVVFRGEAQRWRDAATRVEWLETIPGGPGYHIRKLRYEALPGLWIPALLYEPERLNGKVPVVLNVNGHERVGKVAPYKQVRCINQARRGMLALNVEWLGMGQLRTDNFLHYRMNQLDLCGTSGLAPFYLAMKRALDLLLDHPNADRERVAVAGLSGGGWQTIIISALDTRVTLANPVAGYSSFRTRARFLSDLGDSEQTPNDLATVLDYTHLTAMRAPRPTLLTYNAEDSCCFRADHALEPLVEAARPIFALYGKADHLRWHVNHDPGNHNFERDNREAFYRMLRDHVARDDAKFDAEEIPCDAELKSAEELEVALPEENADFHTLALALARGLPRNSALPGGREPARRWQEDRRASLRELVRFKSYLVTATSVSKERHGDLEATRWRLKMGEEWTVPALELARGKPRDTAIVIADAGRAGAAEDVARLLASGKRVLALDPFYFGESKLPKRDFLWALLVAAVGDRPLGVQASQVAAAARWARSTPDAGKVSLVALGPRTSTIALVAAALEEEAIGEVELFKTLGSLKEVIESNWSVRDYPELFCFGLLEEFDVRHLAALVAPRKLKVRQPSDRVRSELEGLRTWYAHWGLDFDLLNESPSDEKPPRERRSATTGRSVRVAGIVLKWLRTEKEANYRRIEPKIREAVANGARIVCTTECFLDGYAIADKSIPLDTYRALGEPIPGGRFYKRLAALADELDIFLVAGMLEAAGETRYNTAVLIGPDGKLIGKYHKQKLGHELVRNTPGDASPVFPTPYGRVGVMICADRRYKDVVRRICDNGADFLLCPSGGMFGPKTNDPILQARSRENRIPIIFVHPAEFLVTGPDGSIIKRTILGDRLLIDPADVGGEPDKNRIFYFDLPLEREAGSETQESSEPRARVDVRPQVDHFAENVRSTEPLSPQEEAKSFHLPPGFEIQLVAAEPDIQKPMNLAFDQRGRLWVTGSTEYPFAAQAGKGRDTIKVLEDTDGDGRAEKITTFADGLNIPIGIYPYKDGAIAFSIPYIYRLRDTDGDGRADERWQLHGPLGYERDTHGLNNAFRRAFDGWLYICHGFNNTSRIGSWIELHSGNIYRVRLERPKRAEQFTWGQVNPFGMTADPLGNFFTADCHSSPIYQLLRGGYYPSFGKPHDGLGFVAPMMEHSHGSTAIAGIAYYAAENFPPEYRGSIFVGNVMTSRIHRDSLTYHGSTPRAREEPDFVRSDDPWFRPVDLRVGPDGALYVADFYNRIIGHYEVPLDHPGRDRYRGRIWRIVYRGAGGGAKPAPMPADLSTASVEELVAALGHRNLTYRLLATNELVDRAGKAAAPAVEKALSEGREPALRSHGLWVLHRLGALPVELLQAAAGDPDRAVRVHAMRVLSETRDWSRAHRKLALSGLGDPDPFVQRAAADALAQHPDYAHVRPLLELLRTVPEGDGYLHHAARIALRNQLRPATNLSALRKTLLEEADARAVASVALAVGSTEAGAYLLEHVKRYSHGREQLLRYLRHAARHIDVDDVEALEDFARMEFASDLDLQRSVLKSICEGLEARGVVSADLLRGWASELAARLLDSIDDGSPSWSNTLASERRRATAEIAGRFGLEDLRPWLVEMLLESGSASGARLAAARALLRFQPDGTLAALTPLIADPGVPPKLGDAISKAIARRDPVEIRELLLGAVRTTPRRLQVSLAQALAGSRDGAEALLELVSGGQAAPRLLLHPSVRERILAAKPARADERIGELTSRLPPESETRQKLIAQRFRAFSRLKGSPADGAPLFVKHCSACHRIGGEGSLIGPQLDGIGNRGLERILEDVIDPHRNVDVAFRSTTFVLADGTVVSGLYRRDEGEAVIVADATGKEISIPRNRIVKRAKSEISHMPDNFAEAIPPREFNHLVAYLLTTRAKGSD